MSRYSKNKFDVVNGDIHITKEDRSVVGLATYTWLSGRTLDAHTHQ